MRHSHRPQLRAALSASGWAREREQLPTERRAPLRPLGPRSGVNGPTVPAALLVMALAGAAGIAACKDSRPAAPVPGAAPGSPTQPPTTTVTTLAKPSAQPTKGSADAPVTITELAEFYCPFCALYLWETFPQIQRDYLDTGLVKYEFRNLVVHGVPALLASAAGECAHQQGRFWAFHDRVFEQVFPNRRIDEAHEQSLGQLLAVAGVVGLDAGAFDRCLQSCDATLRNCQADEDRCIAAGGSQADCSAARQGCLTTNEIFQQIVQDREELQRLLAALPADERAQIEHLGTPTFFINGHVIVGAAPYEELKALIEQELRRAGRR